MVPGVHYFYVAGVEQFALPRGRMSDLASRLVSPWCLFDVCLVSVWLRCFCVIDMGLGLRPFFVRSSFSISDPSTYLLLNHSVTYALTHHSVSHSLTHCALLYICVPGVRQCVLPTSRMYTACLWHPSGFPLVFLACQPWDNRSAKARDPGPGLRVPGSKIHLSILGGNQGLKNYKFVSFLDFL